MKNKRKNKNLHSVLSNRKLMIIINSKKERKQIEEKIKTLLCFMKIPMEIKVFIIKIDLVINKLRKF